MLEHDGRVSAHRLAADLASTNVTSSRFKKRVIALGVAALSLIGKPSYGKVPKMI